MSEKSNIVSKEEILEGPEYFYCEKLSCRLKIEACLQRQQANLKRRKFEPIPFFNCQQCPQGLENFRFYKNGGDMSQEKPIEGKGIRNIDCEKYKECLNIAIKNKWDSFNCGQCPLFPGQKQASQVEKKTENIKTCKKCGENPTIHPNSPYCSGCLHDMRKAKQKAAAAEKKKSEGVNRQKAENTQKTRDTAVKIDFGKYSYILKEIEKVADKEMRPLGLQIAYILQKYLKESRG